MIKFGTGGWRAIIADEFTKQNVKILMAALSTKIIDEQKQDKSFIIGYDRRFMSVEAARWCAEVVAAYGIKCEIINRQSPTPLVMYTIDQKGSAYGVAITASHNPAIYNGVKVFSSGGRDADEFLTEEIEKYIENVDEQLIKSIDYAEGIKNGSIVLIDTMNSFIDRIMELVDMESIRKAGLKIALDPMHGVSRTALQTILMTARCEVDIIHERHDALFGGRMPAPTEKTLSALVSFVEENNIDLGIATDGDADRLGVIDDTSKFIHPNKILVLIYYYLLKYKSQKGDAVRNTATTHLLDRVAKSFGYECHEVPVGFKYISAGIAKYDAIVGGESSGGLTVRGHIRGKDGIYAAALLVEMIAVTGKKLSLLWQEIIDIYGNLEMEEGNFSFPLERKQEIIDLIINEKKLPDFGIEIEKVNYNDGCKVFFKNGGWVAARFSGTEPLLRIFCELETKEKATEIIGKFAKFLEI